MQALREETAACRKERRGEPDEPDPTVFVRETDMPLTAIKSNPEMFCHDCEWVGFQDELVPLTDDKYDVECVCCPRCHSIFVVENHGFFKKQAD